MKIKTTTTYILLTLLSVFILSFQHINAQNVKKNKLRLKAQFVNIIDGKAFIEIKATSKINKRNTNASGIDVFVFNELEDDNVQLGKVRTNYKGEATFIFKNLLSTQTDTSWVYNILISFKGNEKFKKAKKRISFKNVSLEAKLISKDSINYISAKLLDPTLNIPISDVPLTIQVQRLFNPLIIGKEFNSTDENGEIMIPIEEGIPGVNGVFTLEVVLNDSDEFGTVKNIVEAPIGTLIVDESTFDQRTMWSPRNKTPIFLLIFPNLLIAGIWGLIIYLVFNLFKISKSKI